MKPLYTQYEYDNAKSIDKLSLECYHCQKTFYTEKKIIKHSLNNEDRSNRNRYCGKDCFFKSKTERENIPCKQCGKEIIKQQSQIKKTTNSFCDSSCAAKYNNKNRPPLSKETKIKIGESVTKANIKNGKDIKKKECCFCKKVFLPKKSKVIFCSTSCSSKNNNKSNNFSDMGKKSAEKQRFTRRSKNEILFYELCNKHFKEVKHNESIFNGWDADVIIEDIKLAVLWNGTWHYKKITKTHSVKQVQNRDVIKIKEIEKLGYTPFVIKDMGKFNKYFVNEQFNNFINIFKK